MPKIELHHKRYFVKMLALGESPSDIAEAARGKFLISPDEEDVRRYMPETADGEDLPDELRDYFYYIRERHFEGDDADAAAQSVSVDAEGYVPVAKLSDLEGASHLCVEVDGEKIAVFKWGNALFALSNTCSHAGGPLSEGSVDDGKVQCPLHGARFDLASGAAADAPATEGVESYPVRLGETHVEVAM